MAQSLIFADGFESGDYFRWSGAEFGAADDAAPEIFLLAPERQAVYNDDSPVIEVGFFDLDSGIEPASLRVALDGADLLPACSVGAESASCASGPLGLGTHVVTASIWDLAGNRSSGSWSFEVAIDTQPPTVSFRLWDATGPDLDTVYNDETPVFNLFSEDDLAGVDPESVTVSVDAAIAVECVAGSEVAFCETPVLVAGAHQVQVTLQDFGGNPAAGSFDFELFFDEEPPTVTVSALPTEPRSGDVLQISLSYADSGLGLDLAGVRLLINGVERTQLCSVGPETATCQATAGNPGGHVLEAFVRDVAGNETRDLLRFRVAAADTSPPEIALLEPAAGRVVTTPDPVIRLSLQDDDTGLDPETVRILLDAADLTADCAETAGVFACTVTGLARGSHQLEVQAADLAGNAATSSFPLLAQLSLEVGITQPADGDRLPGAPLDVQGTTAPGTVAVEVNGVAASLAGTAFTALGVGLHEGLNVLDAVARDAQGNVGYDTIEVLVDSTRPQLSVQFPPQGYVSSEPEVAVAGIVHDPGLGTTTGARVSVSVDGRAGRVAHRSFQVTGVPLAPGSNLLTVRAEDLAGNFATQVLEVVYDPSPDGGRLAKVSGDQQSATVFSALPEPLVVELLDGEGSPRAGEAVVFEVSRGNGRFPGGERRLVVSTDAAGRASTGWVLGSRAGTGVHRAEASVAGTGKVAFLATAEAGPPRWIHVVSGDGQQGAPGRELPRPLIVVVTDAGQNPVTGAEVEFEVVSGGGLLGGEGRRTALTDDRGYAAERLTLGPSPGIAAHRVEAFFSDQPQLPAVFQASAFLEGDPASTSLSGVVLDNAGVPVPGYTLRLRGSSIETVAGAGGEFTLAGVPLGQQVLLADGSTATRPGLWPDLEYEVFNLAGIDNRKVRPIFVLPIDEASGEIAGGSEEVVIKVPQVPGFSLRVLPGSASFPDGSTTGVISATAVHADKIPTPPPEGMQPRFIVTIQPAGAIFDPPAPVTFPNVDGLEPGAVTELFSFDHDLGSFVSIGTGTVSDDGTLVASDPGFGITKAGWHCAAPQSGRGQSAALSVDYLGPNPLVLLAGTSTTLQPEMVQAAGTPARNGEYHWNIQDPGIAKITAGTCAGQPICPASVAAGTPGETLGTIRFLCTATREHVDTEFDIVVAKLRLAEVSFSGDSYQEVSDDAGMPYSAPHWKDNSQPPDGDASDPPDDEQGFEGDRRFPVAFKRNTRMKVTAKFAIEPVGPAIDSLHFRGIGPAGITFPATEATVLGTTAEVTGVEMAEALADMVAFHNPLVIDWEASVDGGKTWSRAGRSENRVYVTLESPERFAALPHFETLFEIGGRNAGGATTPQQVFDGIWADFESPQPGVQRKAVDGRNRPDGLSMRYWIDISDPNFGNAIVCFSVRSMLAPEPLFDYLHGVGTCSAWSELLISTLYVQGIKGAKLVKIVAESRGGLENMLVKEWLFVGPGVLRGQCGTLTHRLDVDLLDQEGVPGQGVSNPPGEFNLHYIVKNGSKFYDPSYGKGPYRGSTQDEAVKTWKNDSLSGYSQSCQDSGKAGRKVRSSRMEVSFEELEGGLAP